MKANSFPNLLHAFFHDWIGRQRNLSHHTVLSYRDTWRLFLRFASQRKKRTVAALSLAELDATEVLAFLQHLEEERKAADVATDLIAQRLHRIGGALGGVKPAL